MLIIIEDFLDQIETLILIAHLGLILAIIKKKFRKYPTKSCETGNCSKIVHESLCNYFLLIQ